MKKRNPGKSPLESVVNSLPFTFEKDILVKPLEIEKISKEFTKPVTTGEKDEDGFEKYNTETVIEEVDSDFRKGIVLALPATYEGSVKIGDTIVYVEKFAKYFDLYKDSQLVKPYDVIAVYNGN